MSDSAQQQVSGPATGLMITAGIGIVFQILGIIIRLGLLGASLGLGQGLSGGAGSLNMLLGGAGIVFNIIGIAIGIVVFMGASKMKNMRSYGFAMAAAILAMVPCISPCCLLGLPIGIWAIIILVKPEVKAAFTA